MRAQSIRLNEVRHTTTCMVEGAVRHRVNLLGIVHEARPDALSRLLPKVSRPRQEKSRRARGRMRQSGLGASAAARAMPGSTGRSGCREEMLRNQSGQLARQSVSAGRSRPSENRNMRQDFEIRNLSIVWQHAIESTSAGLNVWRMIRRNTRIAPIRSGANYLTFTSAHGAPHSSCRPPWAIP